MKECWTAFFSYILFLIFSPIRFLPYTFSPLSTFCNLQIFDVPQNKTKPLFLVARIPKEHPLRHLGDTTNKAMKECWTSFFSYILFLIFSPIRFLPYTFSPLSTFCNLPIFDVPQNKTKPLFLVARIPKEHPLRHLGYTTPQGNERMLD